MCPELLDLLQIRTLQLHPHGRLDSGQRHVEPVLYRHGPGISETWELELGVHFPDELFVRHSRPPLLARLEHHGRVIHIKRSVIGRTVRSADRTEDSLNLWKGSKYPILLLQELRSLGDGNARKCGGHVQ